MLIRFIPKLYCLYQVYTCYDSFMLRQFDVLTRNADFDQDCMQCIHIHDMMHLYMTMGRLTINTDYDQDCIQCIHAFVLPGDLGASGYRGYNPSAASLSQTPNQLHADSAFVG